MKYSSIHGKGVFAKGWITRGQIIDIVSFETNIITPRSVDDGDGNYYDFYSPFNFLNHSDDPNTILWCHRGQFTLEVIRSITKDEEVTFDYEG